jgi:hypothetical protein
MSIENSIRVIEDTIEYKIIHGNTVEKITGVGCLVNSAVAVVATGLTTKDQLSRAFGDKAEKVLLSDITASALEGKTLSTEESGKLANAYNESKITEGTASLALFTTISAVFLYRKLTRPKKTPAL